VFVFCFSNKTYLCPKTLEKCGYKSLADVQNSDLQDEYLTFLKDVEDYRNLWLQR